MRLERTDVAAYQSGDDRMRLIGREEAGLGRIIAEGRVTSRLDA